MSDTIRLTIDNDNYPTDAAGVSRQARSRVEDIVSSCLRKTIEIETNTITQEVSKLYAKVIEVLKCLQPDNEVYSLSSVTFSVVLDTEGKASLLSTVSAASKAQAGLTFVLTRKEPQL